MRSEYSEQQEARGRSFRRSGGKGPLRLLTMMLPALVVLVSALCFGVARAVPSPAASAGMPAQPLSRLVCLGFGVWSPSLPTLMSSRGACARAQLSLRMQARGGSGKKGRGGKGNNRQDPDDDEEEISTYVSCPKCMSDSFIKAEVLGESKMLRCNNCDKSFNATAADLKDINDVYSPGASSSGDAGGLTDQSFFEMFGDKKTLKPPT